VFAPGGGGFMAAMLAARDREAISVVADQWGSPTAASACAQAALLLAHALVERDRTAEGTFHAAGADGASRAELAEALFAWLPRRPEVIHTSSADFPSSARRPRDTRLSSAKLAAAFGWRPPPLSEAIGAYLARAEALT
jgi:dTDP-4-dehydrorhamnose reductase